MSRQGPGPDAARLPGMASKGAPVNQAPSPGRRAAVVAGVSTVWTSPDAPRACDAPAIADTPDLQAWVSGMTREQRKDLHGRTLTQVLFGDVVQVEEVADGWARIVAIEQAAPALDPRGYPGWLPAAHIVPDDRGEQPAGGQYVVDAMFSALHERPEAASRAVDIVLGTRLTVLGQAQGRYAPVAVPGRPAPLWADLADLAPATIRPAAAARDLLPVALRLQGVPYIWGGASPYGIDCSGLVYLAHRRLNVAVPRDAGDQADASVPVGPGEQAPGHLCFFAQDRDAQVDHVGLLHGPGQLIHASGSAGHVQQEPIEGKLARCLTAIHRTLP
jgi:gamma-D-glutamyl-L-lysine dipeptidyl-peptidase